MKRRVMLLVLALMIITAGVVSAAADWGKFEGYNIVRLVIDGKTVTPKDTPPVILKGRTMVPVSMLEQAGVTATWDKDTYTVNVKSNKGTTTSAADPVKSTRNIMALGGTGITFMNINNDMTALVYFEQNTSIDKDWPQIDDIFKELINFNTTFSRVEYGINGVIQGVIEIRTKNYVDYMNGKISDSELQQLWLVSGPLFDSSSNNDPYVSNSTPDSIEYPELYSNDLKTYLGKLTTNTYDTDSVFNPYGTYGSKYATDSIWNEYGTYGSMYSNTSAFNTFATQPPVIVLDGEVYDYVTANTTLSNGVHPNDLYDFIESLGY